MTDVTWHALARIVRATAKCALSPSPATAEQHHPEGNCRQHVSVEQCISPDTLLGARAASN